MRAAPEATHTAGQLERGDRAGPCPSCGADRATVFDVVRQVPVHCCLLMKSAAEARATPRGELALAFCDGCGFVFNAAFDPEIEADMSRYEETQGFSPTFNAFARNLARRLVDDLELTGKTTLEIGCGKGEFLRLLCSYSNGLGVGLDPAYVPGRLAGEGLERLEYRRERFDERFDASGIDFVCCRHTLEHIGPTGSFVGLLRETLGPRLEVPVFFEVPDALRILRSGAFWDLYYEHCSYFSAGSLARLFRAQGFDPCQLDVEYDGQYLTMTAFPADSPTPPRFILEEDLETLREAVARFPEVAGAQRSSWREFVRRHRDRGRVVVLWGGSSKAVSFLDHLGPDGGVEAVVDVNPHKHGFFLPGSAVEVVAPEQLKSIRPDVVIVMNAVYEQEIRTSIEALGLSAACVCLRDDRTAPEADST